GIEVEEQQQRDQREADRHHDLEPGDRVLQVAELADPFEPRAGRQPYVLGHLGLRLLDRAAKVALTYAELDRQVTLLRLAVDVRRARPQPHGRALAERDLGRAAGSLDADAQVLDGLRALPVFRRQPHHDGEVAVAARLEEVAGGVAADRDPDGGVDIA